MKKPRKKAARATPKPKPSAPTPPCSPQTVAEQALRQRAEAIFRENTALFLEQPEMMWPDEAQKTLHELRVHQIELEMQNAELRNSQAALAAANERYFDFYDLAPVGYITVSAQGLILQANLTTVNLLGLPKEQLLKLPLSRFISKEDQDRYYMLCHQLIKTGRPQATELRMIGPTGAPFWARLEALVALEEPDTQVLRFVLSDISERKLVEDKLRLSEERFRGMLRDVPGVAVQGYSMDGITTYWNQSSELLYGYSAQEAIGRSLLDLIIPPEMRAGVTQAIRQMAETGQPIPASELSLMKKDGSRVMVFSSHAIVQLPGHTPELFCLDVDLTTTKQTENALRASEDRYRSLFDSSLDPILLTTPDGQILAANAATCRFLGRTEEEIKRLGRSGIVDTSDERLALAIAERSLKGSFKGELTFLHKTGEKIPCEVSSSVFTDNQGNARTSMIVRDLTERKRIEQALRESEERHRQTIESAVDGILQISSARKITGANSQMQKLAGRSLEQLLGLPITDLFSPEEIKAKPPRFDLLDQGLLVVNVRNLLRPDGTTLPAEMHSKKMPDGTYQSIYRDITMPQRAGKALRESEERYHRITEAVTDYIYTVRVEDGRAVETKHGPGCQAVTGYQTDEFAQEAFLWLRMVAMEDQSKVKEQARQILAGEDPPPLEHRIIHKSGAVRWVSNTFVPHRNEHGALIAYDGLIKDITARKRAEDELRHVQSNLSALFESTNDLIWSVDLQHRMVAFNSKLVQHCRRSYGTEVGLGKTPKDFLPPERAALWGPLYERALTEGPYRIEYGLTDGRKLELSFHPIVSDEEKIGVSVFGKDITERKRAEELLRKSKKQYDNLAAQIPIGIYILHSTPAGTFSLDYASPKMAEIFATQVENLLADAQIVISAIHPEDRAGFDRLNQEGLTLQRPFNWEGRALIQGTVRWLHLASLPEIQENGDVLWFGIVNDITERKQAETALRESENSLRESQLIAGLGSYVLDISTGTWSSSDVLDTVFGIDRTYQHTVENWAVLIHPDDRPAMVDYFNNQVLGQHQEFNRQYRIIRQSDQEARWVHGVGRLEFDAQGRVLKMRGTIQDITERKQAESDKEILAAQNQQLQKADSLSRMAGAIAHHFNNQLHAVMMRLEMAIEELPPYAEPIDSLNEAIKAARKAAEVSTQMLTYLGQTFDKTAVLDLSDVCQRGLTTLRTAMPQNMILETNLPAPGPRIKASASQLQQVLANLVTNAWEAHGEAGGTIRLAVKTVAAAKISVRDRYPIDWKPQDAAYACLKVTDTGCGIAARDIEKLFDPFFSSKFTGRGLGLSVVLGIVRSHQGGVTVESKPGKGSEFRVFFPLATEVIASSPASVAPEPKKAPDHTILVIEPAPALRTTVTLALEHSGFKVLTAADGPEAISLFRQHPAEIECVLCDVILPGMDGWATLSALRELAPSLPVIFVSSYSEALVMAGHHSEKPQAFLEKPYELSALKHALTKAMRRHL